MTEEQARAFCRSRCDAPSFALLERFVALLALENARQNLVSDASLAQTWVRHMADSIQLLDHAPRETSPWLDLGTGAGFPGLIIAMARPEMAITLVESRKRRVEWLQQVTTDLGLSQVRVLGSRLETVDSFSTGVICARAFAPLPRLLKLSARFSTDATWWLLPKGRSAAQELAQQPAVIRAMFHVEQSATDPEAAILVGRGRAG